ncbi:MAG: molybdopterin-dependent oxidoreductase [Limisphaerales bacterium]
MKPSAISRLQFLRLGTAGVAAAAAAPSVVSTDAVAAAAAVKKKAGPVCESGGCCITQSGDFYNVERGNPLPYKLPPEKQREIGMVRETWRLEIIADPESNSKIGRPLLKADGTALTFDRLMEIARTRATSYFKVITCNNISDPLGHGLWEGVPLRDVLWLAGPVENLRHVYYYGHHNEDPKQIFKCYLPVNRVFEDPPGELPVLLCYKLNGEFLTGERGGPVRMIVPEAYGFKSVKWLQRLAFTNVHQSDDTYASGNNDINSWLKTFARFAALPEQIKADEPLAIHGNAQVGVSGLAKVQYWLRKTGDPLPVNDPHFSKAPWQDAQIAPFDPDAIRGFDPAKLHPVQFDPKTGQPREWPLRYTLCRWTGQPRPLAPGTYELRCRTIDQGGHAQPMPRPFPKSGKNQIQTVKLEVTA